MNLSDEDKATLIAAAKILMREPDNVAIDGDDQWYVTNQDIAENLYERSGLMVYANNYSTRPLDKRSMTEAARRRDAYRQHFPNSRRSVNEFWN